ncbi:MAG: hypothetical protein V3V42_01735 [Candidatus Omnitrophota bacterium]
MKRFVTVLMIICFFMSVIPVFTGSPTAYGETVFQRLSDDFAEMGKEDPESKQTAWTAIFRKAKKNISTWSKASSQAESFSLRGNKAEINRRRGL